jgi:mannose-6-phosphate isomerase-like protein (cupin superfamily)
MIPPMFEQLLTQSDKLALEEFEWGTLRWLCHDKLSPGALQTLGICHIWPGMENPLHYHPNCEELLYVQSGRGRHRLNDEFIELHAGMTLRIPAGVRHNFHNSGADILVCFICFSSGNRQVVFVDDAPSASGNPS